MPKKKPLKEVQEQRQAYKEKVKKYPVSTVYLQVIGSGAPGAPRSLYVFTEHCRYIFNCGEGTQRLANEHKVKLSMTEHIFITYKSWENVGGMPGILLTLQDAGVPQITLHGPPGIDIIFSDTRNFMRFQDLKIDYHHYERLSSAKEVGPLIVKSIPLWSSHSDKVEDFDVSSIEKVGDLFGFEKNKKSEYEKSLECPFDEEAYRESIKSRNLTLAYICRPIPKPGALRSKLCSDLGVPCGPLMGLLKQGQDVTLPNGKIVKAADVTEPPCKGPVFIIVEIPTKDYIPSFLCSTAFDAHMSMPNASEEDYAQVIVHFSSHQVTTDHRYLEWMARFPKSTEHIFINEKNSCTGSERVHKIQHKLNHIYPDAFPMLNDQSILVNDSCCQSVKRLKLFTDDCNKIGNNNSEEAAKKCICHFNKKLTKDTQININGNICDNIRKNHHEGFSLLSYHLRPHKKMDFSGRLSLNCDTYISDCYDNAEFPHILTQVKSKISEHQSSLAYSERQFPHLVFLGTGSCIPNKTRNTSGILFNISETSSLIMDCGEGTYGQMMRLFGHLATCEVLQRVKGIFVSHLHADHHIGLIRILLARKKAFGTASTIPHLLLLAPAGIIYYLKSYHLNFEPLLDGVTLIANSKLNTISKRVELSMEDIEKQIKTVATHLELSFVKTCYVRHCPHAFGISVTTLDDYKVVYSGDTMPSANLASLGEDCDLLIHEATMEDDLKEDAILKRHSTTSDALEVAHKMNAKALILTHFSQRYAKVPLLKEEDSTKVVVAFDNMIVRIKDLPILPHLYPAFVSIFSEDYDEMIEKNMKRKSKEQLKQNIKKMENKS